MGRVAQRINQFYGRAVASVEYSMWYKLPAMKEETVERSSDSPSVAKNPRPWREFFLPKWEKREWTWQMLVLLSVAVLSLIDSLLIPISRDVDPGRSGEGFLFLILGFRAASRTALPTSVVVVGGCLALLVSALNHRLIRSPSWIWMPAVLLCLAFVLFWGRGKRS